MRIMAQTEFDHLMALAEPLVVAAREVAPGYTVVATNEDSRPLAEEAQAMKMAIQAVMNRGRLKDAPTMIMLGGLVGSTLAQCSDMPSDELVKLFYAQFRETFKEVRDGLTPQGSA